MAQTPEDKSVETSTDERPPARLGAANQDALGQALKAYYQSIVSEPLPATLLEKLAELEALEPAEVEVATDRQSSESVSKRNAQD